MYNPFEGEDACDLEKERPLQNFWNQQEAVEFQQSARNLLIKNFQITACSTIVFYSSKKTFETRFLLDC